MTLFRSIFFLLITPFALCAQILEIDELQTFEERLQSVDPSVLVLFDVDDTLIFPKDAILKNANIKACIKLYDECCKELLCDIVKKDLDYLSSVVFAQAKFELVNDRSVALVQSLQQRGIPTIAFTAASTEKYGVIESMAEWRFAQLKTLGFDFRKAFGPLAYLRFDELMEGGPPLFFGGILFSASLPKGEILVKFLERLNCRFSKIILLDDRRSFLESVDLALSEKGIAFEGYLYHEAKNIACPLNIHVAKRQIITLIKEEKWLSDEEVMRSLQEEGSL